MSYFNHFTDQDLFFSVLESIPNGILAIDYKKQILFINKVAESHFNLNKDSIISKYFSDFFNDDGYLEEALKGITCTGKKITINKGTWLLNYNPIFKGEQVLGVLVIFLPFSEAQKEFFLNKFALFEQANDAIFLINEDDTITDCNSKTLKMFGCQREDIIGKNPCYYSPSIQPDGFESMEKMERQHKAILLNGEPKFFEWEHIRLDRTSFSAEVNLSRIEMQNRMMILAIIRDITERKRAEKALQESERKFRTLFEQADDAIFLIQEDNTIMDCNSKTLKMFGCQREDIIGKNPCYYSPSIQPDGFESMEKMERQHKAILLNGEPKFFEWEHIRLDRTSFSAEVNLSRIEMQNRMMILAIIRDITERKRAEKALRESESKLRENLEYVQKLNLKLKGVIESSYDGIGLVDDKGYLILVNYGYERVTGLKKSNVIGRHLEELLNDGVISVAPSLDVIQRKETVTVLQKIITGAEVLITASPVIDENDQLICVIANIRNVNELNYLREENAKYKTLNEKFQNEINELRTRTRFQEDVIAQSQIMRNVIELAIRVAQASCNILITGETGVGKGLLASLIHHTSSRCNNPFIPINCTAIPATLLESELFGYEAGAFSGAQKGGKIGLLETANGGTLLLDEIGDLSLELQPKLLRIIQDQTLFRVGGTKEIKVDIRIIAATNEDLKKKIAQKQFRKDLYYRLNVVPIEIPPLRKRKEDILPLTINFLRKHNSKYGSQKLLAIDCQEVLERYSWPGNIRELESLIERLVIVGKEPQIKARDINQILVEVNPEKVEPISINSLIPLPEAYKIAAGFTAL